MSPLLLLATNSQPQHEVDHDCREQRNGQNRRTQPVIKAALTAHPYTPRAPMECKQRVHHSHHGNEGKETSRDLADAVTEVEEPDGEAAEDDGEVEP